MLLEEIDPQALFKHQTGISHTGIKTVGNWTVEETPLTGLKLLKPRKFNDNRGFFVELYHQEAMSLLGFGDDFVQTNLSSSKKGVVRGLHYQSHPHAMSKLVTCVKGRLYDVAVDIRKDSVTFGQWYGVEIDEASATLLYIPRGFAHGFVALEEDTVILYQCDAHYHQPSDSGIRWNDPQIGIVWPTQTPILSEKDQQLPLLKDACLL